MGPDNAVRPTSIEGSFLVSSMTRWCIVSDSATVRRFDCTFDEDDYCGYSDESDGPVKWTRSKAHEHSSPGRHRVAHAAGAMSP